MPVAGRALVIHDASARIGCGLLKVTAGAVTRTGITMIGTLSGLPASSTAGLHIHAGRTCDDASGVGGHYFQGMSRDPWTTTYMSDANGAARISLTMSDFTLNSTHPVWGRAIVAHSSS